MIEVGGRFLIDLFSSVALSIPPQDSISDVTDVPMKFDPLASFVENWPLLGIKHVKENEIESKQAKINVTLQNKKKFAIPIIRNQVEKILNDSEEEKKGNK